MPTQAGIASKRMVPGMIAISSTTPMTDQTAVKTTQIAMKREMVMAPPVSSILELTEAEHARRQQPADEIDDGAHDRVQHALVEGGVELVLGLGAAESLDPPRDAVGAVVAEETEDEQRGGHPEERPKQCRAHQTSILATRLIAR